MNRLRKITVRFGLWFSNQAIPVDSSALEWVRYDKSRRSLLIRFRPSGKVYEYGCVSSEIYRNLILSESKGRYFNAHIRNDTSYPFRLLEEELD